MTQPRTNSSSSPAPGPTEPRRFRVATPIEYSETEGGPRKTWWQSLGTAFESRGENGKPATISIYLNALPIGAGDGRAKLVLFVDDGRGRDGGMRADARRDESPAADGAPF